jgi:voltage-gated potassium channel
MQRKIAGLSNHYIVCGFGRAGERVAAELRDSGRTVVVVEPDPDTAEAAVADDWLMVTGDGGDDTALISANIASASRLVAATGSDATNLMISLSARSLNSDIFIVARADDEVNERKLLTAGANRVVPIYRSSGRRMAQLAMRPHAVEFTDIVMGDQEIELSIEDITVRARSPLDGATIESCITPEGGSYMIIAVRRQDGALETMPPPSAPISVGDVLVALGTRDQLHQLEAMTLTPVG